MRSRRAAQPQVETFWAGDWREIARNLLPDPAGQRHRHPVARSPWLHHPGTRSFVSYEDAPAIEERAALAAERGLRGAFTWHLGGDDDERTLLAAMARPFRHRPGDGLGRSGEYRVPTACVLCRGRRAGHPVASARRGPRSHPGG